MNVVTNLNDSGQNGSEKFEIARILQTLRYSEEPRAISPVSSVCRAPSLDEISIPSERDICQLEKSNLLDNERIPVNKLDPAKISIRSQTVSPLRNCNLGYDPPKAYMFSPLAAPPQIGLYRPNSKKKQTSSSQVSLTSSHYAPNTSERGTPRLEPPLRNHIDINPSIVTDPQSKNTIIAPILLLPSNFDLLTNKNRQVSQPYQHFIEGYSNLDKKIDFLMNAYRNEISLGKQENSDMLSRQHQLINIENLRETFLQKAPPLTQQVNVNKTSLKVGIQKKKSQVKHESGKKLKICRMDSCEAPAARRTPYCEKHSGPRKCEYDGCTKCAQGRTRFCIAHGGGRRCIYPGCSKGARDRKYCASHGGGRRCIVEYCYKLAVGGCNNCTAHGGGKRCKYEGCSKSAQSSSSYCVRHGGGRKCSFPSCTKVARGKSRLCMSHSTQLEKASQDQDINYTLSDPLCQFMSPETTIN